MNGILLIHKPKNYTSRDIVNIVGKKLGKKKVGHTGTLDPLATGVLVLTIGRYTKLNDMLTSLDKEYIAEIKLGIETDTLDITGNKIRQENFSVTKEDILSVFNHFIGLYHMVVPKYSAVKVKGKKLYQYARENLEVDLPLKDVHIYELELLDFHDDIIQFRCKVEKGTYIRSLIRDICDSLHTIGTMNSLIRTKQGQFKLEDCYSLEDVSNDQYKLLNIREAIEISEYFLNQEEYKKVMNGNEIKIDRQEEYLLLKYNDEEIAIYQKKKDCYQCYVMLKIK